jgi:hypothetical protein
VAARVAAREEALRAAAARAGRGFLGVRGVLKRSWRAAPATAEARRTLRPRVAASSAALRISLLMALGVFSQRYREALAAFDAGERATVFPAGTWLIWLARLLAP